MIANVPAGALTDPVGRISTTLRAVPIATYEVTYSGPEVDGFVVVPIEARRPPKRLTPERLRWHWYLADQLGTYHAWFVIGLHVEARGGSWRTFEVDRDEVTR